MAVRDAAPGAGLAAAAERLSAAAAGLKKAAAALGPGLDLAKRTGADVIAAGSHGYGFFTRLLMGSVSTHLLREAPCSVLIAPPLAASDELRRARAGREGAEVDTSAGMETAAV